MNANDKLVQIYQILCDNGSVRLLFPSINDAKCLIKENEALFDMLLLKKLNITPLYVIRHSKMHKVALQNKCVDI